MAVIASRLQRNSSNITNMTIMTLSYFKHYSIVKKFKSSVFIKSYDDVSKLHAQQTEIYIAFCDFEFFECLIKFSLITLVYSMSWRKTLKQKAKFNRKLFSEFYIATCSILYSRMCSGMGRNVLYYRAAFWCVW